MKLRLTDLTPSKSMFLGPICELNLLKEFPAEQFSTVKTLAVRPKISRKLSIALGFSLSAVAKNAVNDLLKFGSIGFLDFTHTLNHRKTKISSSCSTIVRASTTWSIFTTIMFSRPLLVDFFCTSFNREPLLEWATRMMVPSWGSWKASPIYTYRSWLQCASAEAEEELEEELDDD